MIQPKPKRYMVSMGHATGHQNLGNPTIAPRLRSRGAAPPLQSRANNFNTDDKCIQMRMHFLCSLYFDFMCDVQFWVPFGTPGFRCVSHLILGMRAVQG